SIIATRATVHQALEALPDLYKVPVVLRDIEGHAYANIAERLDRPEGTIKAQIARGRAMVAAHLRDTGVTERSPGATTWVTCWAWAHLPPSIVPPMICWKIPWWSNCWPKTTA